MGVNWPGSVGADARSMPSGCSRLCPCEKARPADVLASDRRDLPDMLSDGYGGALHLSHGRVIEVSTAAMRLILSGTMGPSEPEGW